MAFNLKLWANETEPRMTIRFGLMPHLRTRVVIERSWLDGHILYPGHRAGYQKMVCHGSHILLDEITRVQLQPLPCFHAARVMIRTAEYADVEP